MPDNEIIVLEDEVVTITTSSVPQSLSTPGDQIVQLLTTGSQGPTGPAGPPGIAGPAGPAGPQGPPGDVSTGYRAQVEPVGAKDSVNLVFTFPEIPLGPTFELYQNGLLEDPSNYTLVGNVLTLTTPPKSWWRLAASYFV